MSTLIRIFANKRSRTIGLVVSISVAVLCLAVVISTFIFQRNSEVPLSLQPKIHSDLSHRPMQTYEDSLSTTFPADASKYPDKQCPALAKNWVENENLQTGISMTNTDWQNLEDDVDFDSVYNELLDVHDAIKHFLTTNK